MRTVNEHEVHTAGTTVRFSTGSTLDVDGAASFALDPTIPDEAYGVGWNGVLEPVTKNAVYDKIEAVVAAVVDIVAYFVQAFVGNPVLSTTMYFGSLPQIASATPAIAKVYVRSAGTIKTINIFSYSVTAGTGEAWSLYLRLNNTTDTLIATVSAATNERVWFNAGLSIAVADGDYFEIKCVNPAWVVSPLNTTFGGYVHAE